MDQKEMASMGGKARAKKLGKDKLSAAGRKAAITRWAKRPKKKYVHPWIIE